MRRVPSTDDLSIAVHEHPGSGPAALLCHATGFHGAVWDPLVAELRDALTCVALDFRAHGASAVPEGASLAWEGMADDVLAVVDGVDLPAGETVGIGHSMGGAALLLAELRRPGTFRALWLFEPIVFPSDLAGAPDLPTENPLAGSARRRRRSFPSAAEALANFASKPPFDRLRADALHAYVRHGFVEQADGSVELACRPEDEARVYEASGHGAYDRLGRIRCPVVVAHGLDGDMPARFAPHVAAAIPGARLVEVPHVGHFAPLEAPPTVAAHILTPPVTKIAPAGPDP